MLYTRFYAGFFFVLTLLTIAPVATMAAESKNMNIAVFSKVASDFEFKPSIQGDFATLISAMKGSQVRLISHARNVSNGDMVRLQQDVLRETDNGLSDLGINCNLTFFEQVAESFKVGGMCKLMDSLNGNVNAVIAMVTLPSTETWVQLYEDKNSGIAVYGNITAH